MITSALPVPAIARAYIDAAPPGDWFLFDMSPLDVTGIPAWKAAFFPEDPAAVGCEVQQGTGYGQTPEQAMIAAVAECHEEVHARLGFARMQQVQGSYDALVAARGSAGVVDPLLLCLPAGSPVGRDTPLSWVEARRWFGGEPVLVPVDVAALSGDHLPKGYTPFTTLITNGLGAGPTLEWAASHGLFECLQRDGNGLRLRALDSRIALTFDDALPSEVAASARRIADAGIDLLPKFATDEFGIANVFVVGADRDPSRLAVPIALSGCGEAADPDRVKALRKAMLEYAHARARKAFAFGPIDTVRRVVPPGYWERVEPRARRAARHTEPRQVEAFRHWLDLDGGQLRVLLADPVFTVAAEKPFADLPTAAVSTPEATGADAAGRLRAAGLDPLILDFTPPNAAMHAVRVVVPGLEVETMSYYRIGERNAAKLLAAGSDLVRRGEASDTRRPIRLSPAAEDRLGGPLLLDIEKVDARVGALYPLYREPGAHEMAFHRAGSEGG
ncbi:YcaO-like family protein [Sphingomonas jatrophae]|uniref:Ribosomal protein S12 methylthiotransferase accessory factor n=1 Tax=Sphingomonas jatrophae TaxID=1166337 RepID=A0A1I6MA57_9SPHN|nr:YcaO-like family protein [Sphingomonas jatrophae]SFS12498.1 ribosomal protein S12 methylthiotransferase accessory factor [Sphingomonas jatrophae]